MDFLVELLAEIAGEVLSAIVDFFTVKNKKTTPKKFDVITRSILKRQAIKRQAIKRTNSKEIQNKKYKIKSTK